jgi:hypothetical protein
MKDRPRQTKSAVSGKMVSYNHNNMRLLLLLQLTIILCGNEIVYSSGTAKTTGMFPQAKVGLGNGPISYDGPRTVRWGLPPPRRAEDETSAGTDDNFASCADGREDHDCFHGGVCRPILENDQYHCDCSTARDSSNGTPYVGKWCHLPPQVYCNDGDVDDLGGHFCVNNGTCMEDSTCDCGEDFVGLHCEYQRGDVTVTEDDLHGGTADNPDGGVGGDDQGGDDHGDNTQSQQGGRDCPLQCQNGGTCNKADDSSSPTCNCLDGYIGDLCESIQDLGTPCGHTGQSCLHGSTCVRTLSGQYACDCTTAAIGGSNATHLRKFTGRWCQFEASTYCDEDRRYFCANGGRCVGSSPTDDGNFVFSCQCDEMKWTGPSCEFEIGSEARDYDYEDCSLTCLNGGVCRKGAKEDMASTLLANAGGTGGSSSPSVFSEDFDHCACPDGYAGLVCEHRYDVCGNREHFCLHGSKCTQADVGEVATSPPLWTCECEEPFRPDGKYVGQFCQHHHSMLCTTEDTDKSVYNPATSVAFCVNDGVCTEIVESGEIHPGCSCPPGYTGAHCELLDTIQGAGMANQNGGDGDANSAAIIFACSVLGILLAVILLLIVLRWRQLRSQTLKGRDGIIRPGHLEQSNGMNQKQSAIMTEEIDFDPDFDERDLEEVELL